MEIGVCAGFDKAALAKQCGFAYLEPQVSAVAAMEQYAFEAVCTQLKDLAMPTPVFNVLFPGDMKLLADDLDEDRLIGYLHRGFARVQRLGGKCVVFGSGRSRMRPESMTYAEAFRRLTRLTRCIGDVAALYGLTIVIEPLNRTECNMINSVAEGACLAAAADHPRICLLADHYHMAVEQETAADIVRVGGVQHAHIAAREGRAYPLAADEEIFGFLQALKQSGYDGRISVEGRTNDMAADSTAAVHALKEAWNVI